MDLRALVESFPTRDWTHQKIEGFAHASYAALRNGDRLLILMGGASLSFRTVKIVSDDGELLFGGNEDRVGDDDDAWFRSRLPAALAALDEAGKRPTPLDLTREAVISTYPTVADVLAGTFKPAAEVVFVLRRNGAWQAAGPFRREDIDWHRLAPTDRIYP